MPSKYEIFSKKIWFQCIFNVYSIVSRININLGTRTETGLCLKGFGGRINYYTLLWVKKKWCYFVCYFPSCCCKIILRKEERSWRYWEYWDAYTVLQVPPHMCSRQRNRNSPGLDHSILKSNQSRLLYWRNQQWYLASKMNVTYFSIFFYCVPRYFFRMKKGGKEGKREGRRQREVRGESKRGREKEKGVEVVY